MQRYLKIIYLTMILMFATMIALPIINKYLHVFNEIKSNENRTKQKPPQLSFLQIDSLPLKYENYFNDNFNLRDNFVMLHNRLEYYLFDDSPIKEVIIGKNGWFYDADNIENYQGTNCFSTLELNQLKTEITNRVFWANKHNIKYFIAIVPTKMNVYPENLPPRIAKLSEQNMYQQFVSLNNDSTINIIDVRKNLLNHKNATQNLYQKTDGHWNDLGAYYGYQEIMNFISKNYYYEKPLPLDDFAISIDKRKAGTLASIMNIENNLSENFILLRKITPTTAHDGIKRNYPKPKTIDESDFQTVKVNENKKLKCLIIRDSFTLLMMKYFQENFKEVIFIHGEWKGEMHEEIILKEKPDIIINIMLETKLTNLIKYPFVPKNINSNSKPN